MDLWAGVAGELYDTIPPVVTVVQNLGATMAGASPEDFTVKVESKAENIVSYGFSLPNGDRLLALWTNGIAIDDDPGAEATLTFPDLSAEKAAGIDVLNGFEQELITETENSGLIIHGFLHQGLPNHHSILKIGFPPNHLCPWTAGFVLPNITFCFFKYCRFGRRVPLLQLPETKTV